ncbi:MAG: hypothetical protein E7616_06190 [Ruminococcaceae bacterium]|nr:hypothetical protein [Oscillospiraceae bacterium]
MTLSEKVSYIKGMMEGMNFEASSNEAKLLAKIVDLLDDMAISIEDLEDETAAIEEFTKEMDEDLADVEEIVFEDEDDDFDDEDWDDEEDDDEDIIEAECPVCGETIYFDDTVDPDDVICPNCHKHFTCVCDGDCECCETPCDEADEEDKE